MLLGGSDAPPRGLEFLVAAQPSTPPIAGVLSFVPLAQPFAALRVRVVRTERRRGVGAALLLAALDNARRSGVDFVFAKADSIADPDAMPFLVRHGFIHASRLFTMDGGFDVLREPMRLLRERL